MDKKIPAGVVATKEEVLGIRGSAGNHGGAPVGNGHIVREHRQERRRPVDGGVPIALKRSRQVPGVLAKKGGDALNHRHKQGEREDASFHSVYQWVWEAYKILSHPFISSQPTFLRPPPGRVDTDFHKAKEHGPAGAKEAVLQ
ncbi:MAG: hypothetical protein ACKOEM_17190 [Planctomycetia bacterium]